MPVIWLLLILYRTRVATHFTYNSSQSYINIQSYLFIKCMRKYSASDSICAGGQTVLHDYCNAVAPALSIMKHTAWVHLKPSLMLCCQQFWKSSSASTVTLTTCQRVAIGDKLLTAVYSVLTDMDMLRQIGLSLCVFQNVVTPTSSEGSTGISCELNCMTNILT